MSALILLLALLTAPAIGGPADTTRPYPPYYPPTVHPRVPHEHFDPVTDAQWSDWEEHLQARRDSTALARQPPPDTLAMFRLKGTPSWSDDPAMFISYHPPRDYNDPAQNEHLFRLVVFADLTCQLERWSPTARRWDRLRLTP